MREERNLCANYTKSILKFLLSHIGLVSLVVGYTIIGAFTFEKLEAEHERLVKKNMTFVRLTVTDDLWKITDNMTVLNESHWSIEVRNRLRKFEDSLIRAMKQEGWDGIEDTSVQQWTFSGALFYSIILITTIGYGHIAPKTDWGKVVTIFYAVPGVPLMMLCLANIGDGMAHSFRFLYWKVCCYACTKRPKKKRKNRTPRPSRRYPPNQQGSLAQRNRASSFRRSTRASQRSADSHLSDSAFYSYSDPEHRMFDDLGEPIERKRSLSGPPRGRDFLDIEVPMPDKRRSDTLPSPRASHNTHRNDFLTIPNHESGQEVGKAAVLFNRYALEREGVPPDEGPPLTPRNLKPEEDPDRSDRRMEREDPPFRDREDDREIGRGRDMNRIREPEILITQAPRCVPGSLRSPGRQGYTPEHLPPVHKESAMFGRGIPVRSESRNRLSTLDEEYLYNEYYEEEEVEEDEEGEEEHVDKPVPIWLGIMLVVAYIFGGAFLFSGWEGWNFLNSVYFCFITLTTIGFGDFVPAQEKKENAELSIALCSIYLLFGIALLAMSFNLVQEEVINNVKSVAKKLGIIKEEGEEEEE